MNLKIESFIEDTGLSARSMRELFGWTTFTVEDVATVSLFQQGHTLFIENLFVVEGSRRKGVGTRVCKIVEDAAREAGFVQLCFSINAGHKDPSVATVFAKSLGMRVFESGSGPTHVGLFKPLKAVLYAAPNPPEAPKPSEAQA